MPRQPALKTPLQVTRKTIQTPDLRRLDRAYQLLLAWAKGLSPKGGK